MARGRRTGLATCPRPRAVMQNPLRALGSLSPWFQCGPQATQRAFWTCTGRNLAHGLASLRRFWKRIFPCPDGQSHRAGTQTQWPQNPPNAAPRMTPSSIRQSGVAILRASIHAWRGEDGAGAGNPALSERESGGRWAWGREEDVDRRAEGCDEAGTPWPGVAAHACPQKAAEPRWASPTGGWRHRWARAGMREPRK